MVRYKHVPAMPAIFSGTLPTKIRIVSSLMSAATHSHTRVVINMRQREMSCIDAFMIIQEIMTHYNYNTRDAHYNVETVIDVGNRDAYNRK